MLNKQQSYVFLAIYGLSTLFGRLYFEQMWMVNYLQSLLIGLALVALPVLLVKTKLLRLS